MSPDEIKDKVLDWVAEENLEIVKVTKTEKTNFIIIIMSRKKKSTENFPIKVISSKGQEGLVLAFTARLEDQDNKLFLATDKKYRQEMLEELGAGAALSTTTFIFTSNTKETLFRGTKKIYDDGITKDRFFISVAGLRGYYKYILHILKKYKFAPPKEDNFGI